MRTGCTDSSLGSMDTPRVASVVPARTRFRSSWSGCKYLVVEIVGAAPVRDFALKQGLAPLLDNVLHRHGNSVEFLICHPERFALDRGTACHPHNPSDGLGH